MYTSDVELIVVIVCMHYDVPVVSVPAAMHCLCCCTGSEDSPDGKGNMGIVSKLIQQGASVNISNKVTLRTLCFVCVTTGTYNIHWELDSNLPLMYIRDRVISPEIMDNAKMDSLYTC